MDDKSIVELYWQRSEQAIFETMKKYEKYCYAIAHSILNNTEDAEESVNDTYNAAWNSIPPHRPSLLSAYLGKLTRRISIDKYRNRNAQKRGGGELPLVLDELQNCISEKENAEQEFERKQLSEVINSFVNSLPETEQKIFLCRYWYFDSIEAISKQFGFSQVKVRSILHRSRKKLRCILEKEGFR